MYDITRMIKLLKNCEEATDFLGSPLFCRQFSIEQRLVIAKHIQRERQHIIDQLQQFAEAEGPFDEVSSL